MLTGSCPVTVFYSSLFSIICVCSLTGTIITVNCLITYYSDVSVRHGLICLRDGWGDEEVVRIVTEASNLYCRFDAWVTFRAVSWLFRSSNVHFSLGFIDISLWYNSAGIFYFGMYFYLFVFLWNLCISVNR